ncbi:Uncharacterised protein [Mycobacteroides abscessus subsp. bolletii]|nr:Uncharacterised protein [Mycobacteroides abscessus subsp. bolletii]SHP36954.1 Uncharacterised protein [Mycobacteroides abscessus subsp. bolletii]SHR23645.1 Uncharacterised protein [Mycobacteroides abscessus subsp. bolletii]SHR69985.1 Uncharacterised protein [Mycobacteroides abscessus subsp. bolletii]SHR72193.1 Uncharacterised protein [Mycobacteroides abscessus subsp. bolletii]
MVSSWVFGPCEYDGARALKVTGGIGNFRCHGIVVMT